MSIPPPTTPVPERVSELAHGRILTPVWQNQLGGVTFRADAGDVRAAASEPVHIKYGPLNPECNMATEAAKMDWLLPHLQGSSLTVPRVLEFGNDATHEWLVTETLPFASAVSSPWISRPEAAVPAAARALRTLHDAVDPRACPFSWSLEDRVAAADAAGVRVPETLRHGPPPARLVVAHGDACVPNTLLAHDGEPAALVDLALMGVADVWADLAAVLWSVDFNYGPGWRQTYLDAYGIELDRERLDFHLEFRKYA
jgi:kanamycin kinase